MGERITSLPAEVRSLLRTGVAITNVAQCVEELVVNALDAGATCVAVRVDLSCFKIQVVDNGKGIVKSDLQLVGERYATSKCHNVEDLENLCYYGYRGEALSSLRDICSIIEINTCSKGSTQTICKIFQQGKALPISDSTVPRSSTGSTVTVYDLFYNLPVRKKCCNPTLDLEKIRQKIESIALIKPTVSFTLRNDVSGNVILQTHKSNSILNAFTCLFGPSRSKSLTEVAGKEDIFSVDGYVSKKGCNKKDYQFIYINERIVLKTKLHKIVNHQLSKSLILRKKLELTSNKFRGHTMSTSPTKTTDQHAIFVLNITCPHNEYDITFEPAKTLVEFKNFDLLQHCLEKTITDFLKRENLHLAILRENFDKKVSNENTLKESDSEDEEDVRRDQLEPIGIKKKPEIRTTDINGLFSKIVKRNISSNEIESDSSLGTTSDSISFVGNTEGSEAEQINENNKNRNNKFVSEIKTPQNQQVKVRTPVSPKVPSIKLNTFTDTPSSGDEKCSDEAKLAKDRVVKKICFEGDRFTPISTSSPSENELSEDPFPKRQQVQATKKKLICIDTPLVKEAKINVSSLSKLRKRKSTEESDIFAKSSEKQKFTKLKWQTDDTVVQKGKDEITNQTCEKPNNENFMSLDTKRHGNLIVSSLQGLRKHRTGEVECKSKTDKSVDFSSFKHSLQELRKHRTAPCLEHDKIIEISCNNEEPETFSSNIRDIQGTCSQRKELRRNLHTFVASKNDTEVSSIQSENTFDFDRHKNNHTLNVGNDGLEIKLNNTSDRNFQPIVEHGEKSSVEELAGIIQPMNEESTVSAQYNTNFQFSSPIDIDKACDSLENCVTEIETIISNTKTALNDQRIDRQHITQGKFHNISDMSDKSLGNSGFNISQQLMSSEYTVQDLLQKLLYQNSAQKTEERSKPSHEFKIMNSTATEQIDLHNVDSRKSVPVSERLCNSDCIQESLIKASLDIQQNTTGLINFQENTDVFKHRNKFDTFNWNETYQKPRFETVQNKNEMRKEYEVTNDDLNVLSYFDELKSADDVFPVSVNEQNVYDTKLLPFDIYMNYMSKARNRTSGYETDDSLFCYESMMEFDESQPFYGQTHEFNVSDDSGIATKDNEIDLKFQHLVPLEWNKPVSPCLSGGFSPVMDTDDLELSGLNDEEKQEVSENKKTCYSFDIDNIEIISTLKDRSSNSSENQDICLQKNSLKNSRINTSQNENFINLETEISHIEEAKSDHLSDNSVDLFSQPSLVSHTSYDKNNKKTFIAEFFSQEQTGTILQSDLMHNISESVRSNLTSSNCSQTDNKELKKTSQKSESNTPKQPSQKSKSSNDCVFSPDGDSDLAQIETEEQLNLQTENSKGERLDPGCQEINSSESCFSPSGDSELGNIELSCKTWIEMADPKSGDKLYINTRSGHSVNSSEWIPPDDVKKQNEELMPSVNRDSKISDLSPQSCKFLKHMMDQHLSKEDDDDLMSVKWKDAEDIKSDTRKVEDLFTEWENPVFNMAPKNLPSAQVTHMSKASTKAYKALNPYVFDKDMLENFKVLGQVDRKFIACSLQSKENSSCDEMIVLIDQHAAHERIRLEKLTEETYEMKDDIKVISNTDLTSAVELCFPEEVVRVMTAFTEEYNRIGIKFSLKKDKRDSITLHTVPTCLLQKDISDCKRKESSAIKTAQCFMKEYSEILQDTRGSKGRLPNTIHKALCSQACHGAIKFGDTLTLLDCEDMLKSLTKCKLPFQCAHGRPSVVPLIQLGGLYRERKRPNLWKIAKHLQHQ